ncbi:hypothetical protein GCM10007868_05600 [Gluconobacter frateurii]|uniref:Uncharacterized protein n=1 Tax=Gluconobacter frateurii NRIC 0228 TaxID=1307946 RepID=A0ABQ0QC06_9PROT|nr:hypothetical protein AA0228_1755 [Gluconobacter frateurii NRIC 0228]GLP89485.1 hypothetical protein GCM10007868_05600 [Gluconobacter frateurii]
MKVEFKPVFPRIGLWTGQPENYGMIKHLALMAKIAQTGASRFWQGATEALENIRASWSAGAHNGNSRAAGTCSHSKNDLGR